MKFMEIVNDEKMEAAEKLGKLIELVAGFRADYGNAKEEIEVPEVNTTDGLRKLTYLSPADKVAKAGIAFSAIANVAVEAHATTPGMVLDKEVVSLLACDPVLVNLGSKTGSSIL